jgi:uncharacterized protein (DUF305 family)
MMSDTDLAKLGRATGATFDQMWLKGMIAHHEGAVEMANTRAGVRPRSIADG